MEGGADSVDATTDDDDVRGFIHIGLRSIGTLGKSLRPKDDDGTWAVFRRVLLPENVAERRR